MKWLLPGIYQAISSLLIALILAGLASFTVQADTQVLSQPLTLPQLLQQTLNHYPSLQSAALQIEKARQASVQIESRLGWQLAAQTGIRKDVSLFGIPVNRLNAGTQLTRQLASGDALSIAATISRDDTDTALFGLPNPATSSAIELQYRKPLAQGKDNSEYNSALTQTNSNLEIQQARQQQAYDHIAVQLIDLYTAMLATQQHINNIQQSIHRSQRLQRFIHNRIELGIAEDKDRLQTKAQLNGLQAQQQALKLARTQQTITLNRLMGQPWQTVLTLKSEPTESQTAKLTTLIEQTRQHSPALKINAARRALTDSLIELQRDKNRDHLDMIFLLGNRSLNGDSPSGAINDNELVAGIQLEYSQTLDQRGNKAALYQAQLERSIIIQDRKQINADLHYDVATLVAELKAIQATIKAYRRSVGSEHAKLDEAEQRYRKGRITIDQVIRFESQTASNELELALQQIDYQHRHHQLELLRGALWQRVTLPSDHHRDALP